MAKVKFDIEDSMLSPVMQHAVEHKWQTFWLPIVAPEGEVDMELVKRELYDLDLLAHNTSVVYDHVTGGKISKPLTLPAIVIAAYEDHVNNLLGDTEE